MAKKYDESNIKRFAGLKGIRKKPTPYIGPNDGNGLWTCIREPLDNCVDLSLKGLNNIAHLVMDSEPGVYWVIDAGPGFPVGVKEFENEHGKAEKLNTFYVATGLTHAGANFDSKEISRGTHGIGIKATNAMSKLFQVWTFREGQWWTIQYKDTVCVSQPTKCKAPKLPHDLKVKKGTVIKAVPDLSLFTKGSVINSADIQSWCQLTAYLVPGIQVSFTNAKGKTHTLPKTKGPSEFISKRLEELGASVPKKMYEHRSNLLDVVVAFSDVEGAQIHAFTNGLKNKDGGEHVKAVVDAMFKSLQPHMKKVKGDKKGEQKWPFTKEDLSDGVVALVNCKIAAPKFNNQPKDRLEDERVYPEAFDQLLKSCKAFWDSNKSLAQDIIKRASELRSKTADFLKDKKLIKNVNAARKGLSTKLARILGNVPVEKRELFLVEGDSAGGGAKVTRDKTYQAIYPLKGKPLNPIDAKKEKVNNNDEIVGLLAALGMDLGSKNPAKTVQYGKVIQLADPDVDGMHINTLITSILWKYTPHLIEGGHVYAVKAPLYKANKGDKVYFGMTKDEVYKKAGTEKLDLTYIKGWGEIDKEDLDVALKPGLRQLYRITAPDAKQATEFLQLMGSNPTYRKQLLGVAG